MENRMHPYTNPEQILNEFHETTERTLRAAEHLRAHRTAKLNHRSRSRRGHRRPERELHVGSAVVPTNAFSLLR